MSDEIVNTNEATKRRISGAVWLIALGVLFLLLNTGIVEWQSSWWALFILIPALGGLVGAWAIFMNTGRVNAAARGSIGGAIVTGTVAFMFLLGANWAIWWPLMIAAPGLALILSGFGDPEDGTPPGLAAWRALLLWVGGMMIALAATFLLGNLEIVAPRELFFGLETWYALFIFVPAVGALINALVFNGEPRWAIVSLVGLGLMLLLVGGIALVGAGWNLIGPVTLILAGLAILAGFFNRRAADGE